MNVHSLSAAPAMIMSATMETNHALSARPDTNVTKVGALYSLSVSLKTQLLPGAIMYACVHVCVCIITLLYEIFDSRQFFLCVWE